MIVIGTSGTAARIRRLRANLLHELEKQYVTTGRAKGLPPGKLLRKYPLRMALNFFVADIGNLFVFCNTNGRDHHVTESVKVFRLNSMNRRGQN